MSDMRTPYAALLAGLCLTLAITGCVGGDDAGSQSVDVVVGGGGDGDRIDGLVSDLDVNGDVVALVGTSRQGDPVLWRSSRPGSLDEELPLTGLFTASDVEVAGDGTAYVLGGVRHASLTERVCRATPRSRTVSSMSVGSGNGPY
jgi:hypothetical protein